MEAVPDPANPSYRDHWGANLNGTVPLPSSDGTKNEMNFRNSDFYIQDGSYLRLKNIQLGYTFPKKWVNKLSVSNLRVYASATNLFTITSYDGLIRRSVKLQVKKVIIFIWVSIKEYILKRALICLA